jgi:hypothetical protein
VREFSVSGNPSLRVAEGVHAVGTHHDAARSLSLVESSAADRIRIARLLSNLVMAATSEHSAIVVGSRFEIARRTLLSGTMASCVVGCGADQLVSWKHGALAMQVTEQFVYWLSGADHAALLRVPRTGGAPSIIYDRMVAGAALVTGDDAVYMATGRGIERISHVGVGGQVLVKQPDGAHRLVLDGEGVSWLVRRRGLVRRSGLDGRGVTTLAEGAGWGHALTQHGDELFWASGEPAEVGSTHVWGGSTRSLARGLQGVTGLVVVGAFLYVAHNRGVSRVATGGGDLEVVAERAASPGLMVRWGDGLCWSESTQLVTWSPAQRLRTLDAGRVQALASEGRRLWWMDGKARAIRQTTIG